MGIDSIGEIDYQRIKDIIQRELEIGLDTGNVSSSTSTTLTDLTKNWGTDQWKNAYVEITDGTGAGQIRLITGNTLNTLTISSAWTTNPDTTSKYRIFGAPAQVTQLINILNQLDIKLSEFRDALRGTGNKTLTDLDSLLNSLKSQTDKLQFDNNNFLRQTIAGSEIQVPTDLQSILPKKAELYEADETSAQSVILDVGGFKLVEVQASADTATTFTVEYSWDNSHWFTYYSSPSAETSYNDVFWTGAQYIRLSSAAAGSSGDKVSLVIGAKP